MPSGWSNKNKTATATVYDGISGVKSYYLSTSSNKPSENSSGWKDVNYSKGEKTIKLNDLDNGTYYLWVKDKAGNISDTTDKSKFVVDKVDKVKPTCSISATPATGASLSVTLKISGQDGESGLASKPYSWNNQNSFGTKDTYVVKKNGTYNGYVKDIAGNIGNCNRSVSNVVRKPNKPTIVNPTKGNWVNYDFSLTVSTTTPASILGYWYYSYDAKNWTRYDKSSYNSYGKDKFVTSPYSAERNQATYIRVCNKEASGANDTANCSDYASTMIRIDKTKPVLNYTLRKMYYNQDVGQAFSGQWSRNEIRRDFKPTDNASGIERTEYNSGGGWQLETNLTNWRMGEGINEADFRTIDKAGNISNTVHIKLMVDWTPPVFGSRIYWRDCNWYTGNGSWFGFNLTDNVSGISSNTSKFEYCYEAENGCGVATCYYNPGWSHKSYINPSDGRWWNDAIIIFNQPNPLNAQIQSAVSNGCVLGHSISTNFSICDAAGNCGSRVNENYQFPGSSCYNF